MKPDIRTREDVKLLINSFYDKVRADDKIGYIFNDVAKVNWEQHLPIMYDFWEGVLFQKAGYSGNPMITHQKLNQKERLHSEHFDRWKKLFLQTVDEHFDGDTAELAKQRAQSIATVMLVKIMQTSEV